MKKKISKEFNISLKLRIRKKIRKLLVRSFIAGPNLYEQS